MRAGASVLERLLEDAAMFPPGHAEVADAVPAHRRHRQSRHGWVIGPLVVSDVNLAAVGRTVAADPEPVTEDLPLAVSVVNTTGAGGLTRLASRAAPGVRVVAVETALRDLDDLAGNARRVAAAARGLSDDVRVFVEIPYASGWERAVAVVEEAGLSGKLGAAGPEAPYRSSADRLAGRLSVLVEADLPFKATAGVHQNGPTSGPHSPPSPWQHGVLNLLLAVDALVDGASVTEAAHVLGSTDVGALADGLNAWGEPQAARVRRRLLGVDCFDVAGCVDDLFALGLLSERP